MHGFVSHYTNRLDSKGRVSIPAQFRAVLTRDGYEGLYCFPSPHQPVVDAGGNALIEQIDALLKEMKAFSFEHDTMSTALYGNSEIFRVDGEGRVMLSDKIKRYAGITDQVVFVGLGYKFQIMSPDYFAERSMNALRHAFGAGGQSSASGEGGA
ncbi:division/cell wall cluster transcriptional repressor MraZ [Amorphus orientalis]|uniref:Transcriptional regulator MraZ n=1 Tax=Amorphus orientalis TaxID=649198 RepID=A0AAE3VPB6_9HYPH|nr:division/cell wall cluster transcriptional repressor MraZ [Amorphus orientalis]MDQ0315306.1 MraZ protein [Amorphus orientalis]